MTHDQKETLDDYLSALFCTQKGVLSIFDSTITGACTWATMEGQLTLMRCEVTEPLFRGVWALSGASLMMQNAAVNKCFMGVKVRPMACHLWMHCEQGHPNEGVE